jgi:hypothetical protein
MIGNPIFCASPSSIQVFDAPVSSNARPVTGCGVGVLLCHCSDHGLLKSYGDLYHRASLLKYQCRVNRNQSAVRRLTVTRQLTVKNRH